MSDLVAHLTFLAPVANLATVLGFAYFALVATLALVASFSHGERSDNAYRVLKLLTRRKTDPPGPRT